MQILASSIGGWPLFDGFFRGPDSYMRLNRVIECGGGPGCPGGVFPRSNAPFGEVLHWPFLQDWLLLAMAAPFGLFLTDVAAVQTAGYLFGPVLQVGAVVLILWATRPLVASRAWILSGVFLVTQLWVLQAFAPSRPDHHGLQAFFFLMAVAGTIQLLVRGPEWIPEAVTGLGIAGGLWVSVEGLVTVSVPLLILGLRWIRSGEGAWARSNARVSSACVVVLSVAVVLDGPQAGALVPVYDRISVVHLLGFFAVTLFWWGAAARGLGRTASARWAAAVGGAVLIAGGLTLPFPGLLRGPLVEVDPRIVPIWLDQVAEYVTLLEAGPRVFLMGAGSLVFALPSAWLAHRSSTSGVRWGWTLILGALLWFGTLSFVHGTRWAYYLSLLAPIPYAWLAGWIFAGARFARRPFERAAAEVGIVAVLCFGLPVGVALVGFQAAPASPTDAFAAACPERELHRVLAAIPTGSSGSAVLAPLWWGPEIIFRTHLDVIATPYHRNHQGILASRDLMRGEAAGALSGFRRHGVEFVLICRGQEWSPALESPPPGSLFERLQNNRAPTFLTPVALPGELEARYGLWRLDPPARE